MGDIISSKIKDPYGEDGESERFFCLCGVRYNGVVGLRSWRIDTMGKQKRPVLEGEDDGEGHSWKVLKANGGAVDVYYGEGGHAKFQLKKADKKTAPTEELVLQRIAEHRDAKRKQQDDDEGGGGGKKAKGTRLAAEAAAVTSEAESSMSPSGSKEDRRVQRTFPDLSTPGRPDRDYDAERRSAAERREHRRMAEGFGNIQKIVDEGGETQIAAGERRAKGLALRGKVRSSGRFGKTHQQRCTSMHTDQCNTTAAIPRKLQL